MDGAALRAALRTRPEYDAAVRAGSNAELVVMLNAPTTGPKRWRAVGVDQVLAIVNDETFSAQDEAILNRWTAGGRTSVPLNLQKVGAWFRAKLSADALTALRALAQRSATLGDEFLGEDDEAVTLADVREAVRTIPKSAFSLSSSPQIKSARAARSALINQGGAMLAALRAAMVPDPLAAEPVPDREAEFVAFRLSVYGIKRPTQDAEDAARVAELARKYAEEGL